MFGLKWDERTTRTAAIWLAPTVKKPLLKLTDEDYNEHGLQELLEPPRRRRTTSTSKSSRRMQATITGWPGGKPRRRQHAPTSSACARTAGPAFAGANEDVFPKRVVVFSPHPDDDVISMGGTFIRLCEQGHEVHVAYQTRGNIAVFDDAAVRHADFVAEYCRAFNLGDGQAETIEQHIEQLHPAARSPARWTAPSCSRSRA